MPLVHRSVTPRKLSATPLHLSKIDSEFIAVNNGTLVNVLRQLASVVLHAKDIFSQVLVLTEEVGSRVRSVKIRLDELEFKAELFDPKLVPVPEGSLEDDPVSFRLRETTIIDTCFFMKKSRPQFLFKMYEKIGKYEPCFPPRSPLPLPKPRRSTTEHNNLRETRRPASFVALRDWKLDDYLDEEIATLDKKKTSTPEDLNRTVSLTFPGQLVQVDVTGRGFDRMKANRRSLVIHTKKVRAKKKRRNTICGSLPHKECGIQTSFSSVVSPVDNTKKYGIDSGHWSSCSSTRDGVGAPSSSSAPSPWDPNSLSTSSDFLFDDEDRSLTPQLENFTDGLVSDSDSVDTEGYFTSFRNECGFPKSKKMTKEQEEKGPLSIENEYELFGKGSTSTTASSCGTVVLRSKPKPPVRTSSAEHLIEKKMQSDDAGWEERVKKKSFIERVPSLVVVTPSPSCSGSPPPLKDPGLVLDSPEKEENEGSVKMSTTDSESGTLSDTDSEIHDDVLSSDIPRASSTSSIASSNSTLTITGCTTNLPQPDVIPDVQQLQIIRTLPNPKLDIGQQYYSLDTVLLRSSEEDHHENNSSEVKMNLLPANSAKIRGARVVLDANGEIIFSSETLRRKRRQKVSFDPGTAVKPVDYDNDGIYARVRESVYDRIRKDSGNDEKLYECIEEIRRHNLKESNAAFEEKSFSRALSPPNSSDTTDQPVNPSSRVPLSHHAVVNVLLETDLDSAIPPVMPELKTLPKIKDRLKRNESYRIATDELPPKTPLHAFSNKRLSLNNMSKKRDIPEEDPAFIQQILNLSNHNNPTDRSPSDSHHSSITLSKFALSPDDRPSFLRRESPPTMDDITKEIYRFRKKFNIQPTTLSRNLCLKSSMNSSIVSSSSSSSSNIIPTSTGSNQIKQGTSKKISSPLMSSTPVIKSTRRGVTSSAFAQLFRTSNPSQSSKQNPSRQSLFSRSRIFPTQKTPTIMSSEPISRNIPGRSVSFSSENPTLLIPNKLKTETSLNDFKKLLQLTKQNKRSSISAVEILKPKIGLETTI